MAVVRVLRRHGHDVLAIAEGHAGAPDTDVVELARGDGRILLTQDSYATATIAATSSMTWTPMPASSST